MKTYPLSWPREANENLPKSQRSGIKQAVHFNEGIDFSAEHSYQMTKYYFPSPRVIVSGFSLSQFLLNFDRTNSGHIKNHL